MSHFLFLKLCKFQSPQNHDPLLSLKIFEVSSFESCCVSSKSLSMLSQLSFPGLLTPGALTWPLLSLMKL